MANLSLSQLQSLLRSVGFPENQIAKMAAIGIYESGGNPNIINDGSSTNSNEYSVGLYQINTKAHNYSVASLKNPVTNAQIALQIWRGRPNYQDWFNSNKKYNNNYQGIAAQSRAIYGGSNAGNNVTATVISNPVIDGGQILNLVNNAPEIPKAVTRATDYAMYAGLALMVLFMMRR